MRRALVATAVAGLAVSLLAAPSAADPPELAEPDYEPTPESLSRHQAPEWYEDAKLGFFIHWGAYSVPAWAPESGGLPNAEWYWQEMNRPGRATHEYHAETYGEEFPYDRFIEQWQPDKFDPTDWLDLFVEGGAKYFVLVSKHHDGLALWDTDTTDRDTVAMGPGRDLVTELFDAAEDYPLKTGLYYSLPEWFHPLGRWRPEELTNPYTGEPIPYAGSPEIDDYVQDHQYPQMLELVDRFDPDVFWCDFGHIGGPDNNASNEVMAYYFNRAKNRPDPIGVTVNDRCGNGVHDFTTQEYSVEPDINPEKWEATRGVAGSFGYNAQEGPEDHLTPDELIDSFADIVSKNGNLLLNLGPRADGTIPELQAERVRALGDWLEINGEAMYGTTYWSHAEDENSNVPVRYTVKDDALYVTALEWPGDELTLTGGLPLSSTSTITLLGSDQQPLRWRDDGDVVRVTMPADGAAATASEHAYTFKITTPGLRQVSRVELDAPDTSELDLPFTASVTVTNPSDTLGPGGEVRLDVPAGWSVVPSSVDVGSVSAGESRTFEFDVTPGADAVPDRYAVTARARLGRATYEARHSVLLGFEFNVALGKPVAQKSLYQGSRGAPELAVDGDTNGRFSSGSVTHTEEPEWQAWWQVDLEADYRIAEIALWNRTDCCSERLSDYYVFVSDDPFTSDSVSETLAQPGVRAFHQEQTAGAPTRLPVDTTGRYVRVQLTSDSDPLSLAEVEILGARTG